MNAHKRHCQEWQALGLQVRKKVAPLEIVISKPSSCPLCQKTFKNVYSMSAHKGHCTNKNGTLHLSQARAWSRGLTKDTDERLRIRSEKSSLPLSNILAGEHPQLSTYKLKLKLFRAGVFKNVCSICGVSEWMGKKLFCELDHINGNKYDHRLENLRILCPNCHSQTDTHAAKNKGKYKNMSR